MNQQTTHPDLAKLTEIEKCLNATSPALSSAQVLRSARAPYLVSGDTLILTFANATEEDRTFYQTAPGMTRFLLEFAWRAVRFARDQRQSQKPAAPAEPAGPTGDFAAECGMKCAEPAFRNFLVDKHGLAADATDDDVRDCVRKALKVKSRSELNAASRWFAMRAEFQLWERHG